jgi:hypothetical protein
MTGRQRIHALLVTFFWFLLPICFWGFIVLMLSKP